MRQILPASIPLPQGNIYYSCLFDILKMLGPWFPCSSSVPFLNHLLNRILKYFSLASPFAAGSPPSKSTLSLMHHVFVLTNLIRL